MNYPRLADATENAIVLILQLMQRETFQLEILALRERTEGEKRGSKS